MMKRIFEYVVDGIAYIVALIGTIIDYALLALWYAIPIIGILLTVWVIIKYLI